METQLLLTDPLSIQTAADLLKKGALVAFPTETVYGLGARIFDEQAIRNIFLVKGRPSDNPVIAHISSLAQVDRIAKNLPESFYKIAAAFFPGPLTLIVPRNDMVPNVVGPQSSTVAIRMPKHEIALALITAVGEPIVAPSANLSGKPSPTNAQDVFEDLNGKISAIIDGGPCPIGIESTVLDLTARVPTILRPGAITADDIELALGQYIEETTLSADQPLKAPGMKYRHYSPNTPITLTTSIAEVKNILSQNSQKKYLILSNQDFSFIGKFTVERLATSTLFATFRKADRQQTDGIIILLDAQTQENKGLMNRIQKAANN